MPDLIITAHYEPEPDEADPADASGLTNAAWVSLNDRLRSAGVFDIEIEAAP